MELSCKSYLAGLFLKLLHGAVLQKLPCKAISQAFAWSCHAEVAFQSYSSSFCMKVSCKSCLVELFLQLLYGTVVQKLPCVKYCSVSPGSWDVLLSNGKSLGRRLSYVGRNQISLPMMLHRSVVHKLPFAAASVGTVLILMALWS